MQGVEGVVLDQVHHGHAAASELALDRVAIDDAAALQLHGSLRT